MAESLIPRTPSAYGYPLLIKQLFEAPLVDAPDQEIVYKGVLRFTYRQFRERVHQRLRYVTPAVGAEVAGGIGQGFSGNSAHTARLRESGRVRKWESGRVSRDMNRCFAATVGQRFQPVLPENKQDALFHCAAHGEPPRF